MAVVITYSGAKPTVDADFDTWGDETNSNWDAVKADLDNIATQFNATQTLATNALPKAGGTLTGDVTLADVAPASSLSAGFRGVPTISIDADRTLLATDAGKCIRLTGTTARTWTIPPAVFPVGTVIVMRNAGTQNISLVRGSGVALRLAANATDANRTGVPQAYFSIYQEDTNQWLASGLGVS